MKTFVLLILLLSGVKSYGDEDIPQQKIDQAYEAFRRKPIDQEELRKVESLSSSEIYNELLKASPSPTRLKEMRMMTLKNRQNDLTLEIRKTLNEFPLTIDTMGQLTFLASLVSPAFEAEIANKILEHPSAPEFDVYFTSSEDFRSHFRSEPALLRAALNRLLSEGRIKKDAESHKKWEASISKFESLQEQKNKREPKIQPTNGQSGIAVEFQNKNGSLNEEKKPPLLLLIIGAFVLFGILVLLSKVWKGKSQR